jgi:hypothetical protein
MRNINLLLIVISILLLSCKKDETLGPQSPFTGNWGGTGISIIASDSQVTLEFDCAVGMISKKVMLTNGQFSEKGTFTQHFGNMPINTTPPEPKPVIYEGNLSGNNISLTMKSEDGKTILSNYTISKNTVGLIVKCM